MRLIRARKSSVSPMQRWFAIFCLSVLIGGCTSAPSDSPTYVFGEETSLDGVIESAELSSFRRGTHLLVRGDDRIFLESKMVNLRPYEGMTVTVSGQIEVNVDSSDWPVMVVSHVEGGQLEERVYTIDAWGMEFHLPPPWRMAEQDGTFLLFEEGEKVPIITLYREEDGKLPKGVPIVVGGKRAERILNEISGHQEIHVLHDGAIIVFLFSPQEGADIPKLQQNFLRLIQSVSFRLSERGEKTVATGSGRLSPCGGTAGILCPQGFYCDITDAAANIGHCVSLTPIP